MKFPHLPQVGSYFTTVKINGVKMGLTCDDFYDDAECVQACREALGGRSVDALLNPDERTRQYLSNCGITNISPHLA